ncbi:hypothetical protein CCICO_08655 [Corynebacterium ciconiae DSM 44920]|uniref:hypothetical protein n=1 Tax=Corynebacterium ciconiae TaxID=227319 RepID=UPI00037A66B4|nr:hypothetical protein [Corynebacterium ciconiae]WKD61740.1 hypothetical protein CCICO_08655 [Corynebacterium ciconiae DSM 44920]
MSLPPVTYDRMKQVLENANLNYEVTESGQPYFGFEEFVCFVEVSENYLTLLAYLSGRLYGDEQMTKAVQLASSYTSNVFVPRVCVSGVGTQDAPGVMTMDTAFPLGAGMTDEQLQIFFDSTMQAYGEALATLSQEMPSVVSVQEEN